jgi:uncharacterized protein (DUF2062 family)
MKRLTMRRWLPDAGRLRRYRWTRLFGKRLLHAPLWYFNRRAVAGGCAVGLFWAFIPLPTQMLPAAVTAMLWRVNLPVSLAMVWVANPLTMPAMFYLDYRLGVWLLGQPAHVLTLDFSWSGLRAELAAIGPALFAGALVAGAGSALAGYGVVNGLWRWRTARSWRRRVLRRL